MSMSASIASDFELDPHPPIQHTFMDTYLNDVLLDLNQ